VENMVERCVECFNTIPDMSNNKYFRKDGKRICYACNTLLNGLDEVTESKIVEKTTYQEIVSFVGTVSRLGKQRVICVPKTIQDTFNPEWKYTITLRKKEAVKDK